MGGTKKGTNPPYDGSTPLDNARHEQFCHEYLIDYNGQKAGERAGYKPTNARVQASELLTKPNIQARLAYLSEQKKLRAQKSADDIVAELEKIGFSNITDAIEWNASGISFLKDSSSMDPAISAAIESVTIQEDNSGVKQKVKMHSKLGALANLMKIHGMDKTNVEHSGSVTTVVEVVNYGDSSPKE